MVGGWQHLGVRILHLVGQSHHRGAELVALELASELERMGHENSVVALSAGSGGDTKDALPPLVDHDAGRISGLGAARALRRTVRERRPDAVLAHGGDAALTAALGLRSRDRPAIIWQRILDFPPEMWRPGRRQMWTMVARRMDAVVALTDAEAKEMDSLAYRGPVWTIPNFRQANRFLDTDREVASARLRRELGVAQSTAVIGFVGHLVHQKRPVRAVEVLGHVLEEGTAAHLVIAGTGPHLDRLRHEIDQRGLTADVTLLGHRDDVEQIFAGVDVAVLVSSTEGFPGVAIEAAMSGCPLVSFSVGGIREIVEDGRTGIVLDEPDTALMAAEVGALLRDPERRELMSAAAREVGVHFSAERIAGRYFEVLVDASSKRVARGQRSVGRSPR